MQTSNLITLVIFLSPSLPLKYMHTRSISSFVYVHAHKYVRISIRRSCMQETVLSIEIVKMMVVETERRGNCAMHTQHN